MRPKLQAFSSLNPWAGSESRFFIDGSRLREKSRAQMQTVQQQGSPLHFSG
jgi:hypothetical protein